MTIVVARIVGERIAVAADTMTTAGDMKLPIQHWALKSICLPGGICVSYCNSPELAFRSFRAFRSEHPAGSGFSSVVTFFERWSSTTNNDFLIAFANPPRLVTVRNGRRTTGISKTHWIGDQAAYERFRHFEHGAHRQDSGRAFNAALFADEMTGSPASDLYSAMQNVVRDLSLSSVGGFVTVLSNREGEFRFSVYSDTLFDWPVDRPVDLPLDLNERIELHSSGENDRYSINQISPGYYGLNAVAFYHLKGRLLTLLAENESGPICIPIRNVEPSHIAEILDQALGFPFEALCLVMSSRSEHSFPPGWRQAAPNGVGLSLFCEVNTMARVTPQAAVVDPVG